MAEAQRKPQTSPREDLISAFLRDYDEALQDARVAAELTRTDGWKSLYINARKQDREDRRKLSEALKGVGDFLETSEIGEAGEKGLGEIKKQVTEVREARQNFDRQTVDPVREPVERCRKIIYDHKQKAQAVEERAGLTMQGISGEMELAIADVERVTWDAETGRVEIKPPDRK